MFSNMKIYRKIFLNKFSILDWNLKSNFIRNLTLCKQNTRSPYIGSPCPRLETGSSPKVKRPAADNEIKWLYIICTFRYLSGVIECKLMRCDELADIACVTLNFWIRCWNKWGKTLSVHPRCYFRARILTYMSAAMCKTDCSWFSPGGRVTLQVKHNIAVTVAIRRRSIQLEFRSCESRDPEGQSNRSAWNRFS